MVVNATVNKDTSTAPGGVNTRQKGRKTMYTVTWMWEDGSVDSFKVDTLKHAETMRQHLYMNELICSVDIENDETNESEAYVRL